jgi:hypothetical protein
VLDRDEPRFLDAVVEWVADGEAIDWEEAERREAMDASDRSLIRQLRVIASIAALHRAEAESAGAVPSPRGGRIVPKRR